MVIKGTQALIKQLPVMFAGSAQMELQDACLSAEGMVKLGVLSRQALFHANEYEFLSFSIDS